MLSLSLSPFVSSLRSRARGLVLLVLLAAPLFAVSSPLSDDDEVEDFLSSRELSLRIAGFLNDVNSLYSNIHNANAQQLNAISQMAQVIDVRWNGFCQAQMPVISDDEALLGLVADFECRKKALLDTIDFCKRALESNASFAAAEKLINSQLSVYNDLKKKAFSLSLVKQSAPQLERLKAKEQLSFSQIQQAYDNAQQAVDVNPILKGRNEQLQEKFISLKNISDDIQQMQFKPFLERIKDSLLSIAAIAIIVIFVSYVISRIGAIKKARETARKMQELMKGKDGELPSI